MSPSFHSALKKRYTEPFICVSYQIWFILLLGFRGKDFLTNRQTGNKNCLRRPCLVADQDKISDLHRGPSIDASNQVSVHLEKRIREEFFRNRPTGNNNCMWRPCLLTDRDNTGSRYRWHSIDDFHQVLVHLAKRFQRRRFFRDRLIINKNCL